MRLRQLVASQHQELQQLQDALGSVHPAAPRLRPRQGGSPTAWRAVPDWQQQTAPHVSPLAPVPQDMFLL